MSRSLVTGASCREVEAANSPLVAVWDLYNDARGSHLSLKRFGPSYCRFATASWEDKARRLAGQENAFHPEAFWALEDDLPYSVDITWSRAGAEFFDVFLKHRSFNGGRRSPASFPEKTITPRPWRSYAHNPIDVKLSRALRSSLRSLVGKTLPSYMMPSAFVFLDSLPRSPNGKIDRNALPASDLTGFELEQNFTAPQTSIEKDLGQIWAELLGLEQVGIHANFFDLGGHSLLATQVMSRLQDKFQVELPLRTFFEQPTIADLALVITEMQAAKAEQTDVSHILAEIESLSEDEAKKLIAPNSEAKKR